VWKEKSQPGAVDELWYFRTRCNDLENEKLHLAQERDALKMERDAWKAEFEDVQSEYRALMNNLGAITDEGEVLQRGGNKGTDQEGTFEVIVEKISIIQEALLTSTQEKDTLRSEHEELKINFEELEKECNTLKRDFNIVRENCNALHKGNEKRLHLEGGMIRALKLMLNTQNGLLALTQEWDTLRSELNELKVNFEEVEGHFSNLKEDLDAIRGGSCTLQKNKGTLKEFQGGKNQKFDEQSGIEEAILEVPEERDTLRLQREEPCKE
jgi:uncharacterized coiled-coil DUF342 family protein